MGKEWRAIVGCNLEDFDMDQSNGSEWNCCSSSVAENCSDSRKVVCNNANENPERAAHDVLKSTTSESTESIQHSKAARDRKFEALDAELGACLDAESRIESCVVGLPLRKCT